MGLTELQLHILIKLYNFGPMLFTTPEHLSARKLLKEGLVVQMASRGRYVQLTRKGLKLLADEYFTQTINVLAEEYKKRSSPAVYSSTELRQKIIYFISKLMAAKLAGLLTHECAYIRKRGAARIVQIKLEGMPPADKELARKLLTLKEDTIEEALREGWMPTIEEAVNQWREDVRSLGAEKLADLYVNAQLSLTKSNSKRVSMLQKPLTHLAEKYLQKEVPRDDV